MVDDMSDRDRDRRFDEDQREQGRRGGYAAAFDERVVAMERADMGTSAVYGVWTGMAAGVVMGLFMMILYAAYNLGFWTPMKILAASVLGPAALTGEVVPIIVGIIVHLVSSAILGMIFAGLVAGLIGRVTVGIAVTAGVLYGLIVWIVAQYIILPVTLPIIAAAFVPWIYGLSHAIYGVVLGLLPNPALKA